MKKLPFALGDSARHFTDNPIIYFGHILHVAAPLCLTHSLFKQDSQAYTYRLKELSDEILSSVHTGLGEILYSPMCDKVHSHLSVEKSLLKFSCSSLRA